MTIEVEITLRETVGPSSPTPPHLKKFNISLLDQLAKKAYTPIIFYYPPNMAIDSNKLKDSLSKTLTELFPFAGRVRDNLWIDCNDQGVLYSEAVVNCRLAEFLDPPDIEASYQVSPILLRLQCTKAFQVQVQINVFACRGIAIGVSFLHRIIDATVEGAFMKRWASIARESDIEKYGGVSRKISSLFPPQLVLPSQASNWYRDISCSTSYAARLVFSPESVTKIVAKSSIPKPSRIEALSAFLWKRAMQAKSSTGRKQKPSSIWNLMVNMRRRMDPPLPENSIGNKG